MTIRDVLRLQHQGLSIEAAARELNTDAFRLHGVFLHALENPSHAGIGEPDTPENFHWTERFGDPGTPPTRPAKIGALMARMARARKQEAR